jgi:anti-sigma-K factor RskA
MTDDPLELPENRETMRVLERSLPRAAPPGDLFERIRSQVEREHTGGATVVELPRRRRRTPLVATGSALAAAAAAVAITLAATGDSGLGEPALRTAIAPHGEAELTGDAELFRPAEAGGVLVVDLAGVPPAPSGHHYEVWVLPEGSEAMIAVGTFTPTGANVRLELPLPLPGEYAAVDISLEENGGPAGHSGTSVAGGAFS